MKYKIKGFTEEEKQDIQERYAEWLKPENIIWIQKEYADNISSLTGNFGVDGVIQVEKKIKSFTFTKSYAEKIWVLEKLKDHQYHSSPYIESRIGDYPINDFNDETHQRILLEEMESGGVNGQGFLSNWDGLGYVTIDSTQEKDYFLGNPGVGERCKAYFDSIDRCPR